MFRIGSAFLVVALALAAVPSGPSRAEGLRPVARPAALVPVTAEPAPPQAAPEAGATPEATVPVRAIVPPSIGPETNLPLPRFVSLKTDEGNVRRGPSLSHRIDWVFLRRDMPLQITAEYGHWRRVVDREGIGGWVHYSLLSGNRTVIVDEDMLPVRTRPSEDAPVTAMFEAGVIARLGECTPSWCRISAGGYRGWAPKPALWGVAADEIRD